MIINLVHNFLPIFFGQILEVFPKILIFLVFLNRIVILLMWIALEKYFN